MEMITSLPTAALPARAEGPARPASQRDARVEETGALSFSGVLQRQQELPAASGGHRAQGRPTDSKPSEASARPDGNVSPAQAAGSQESSAALESAHAAGNPVMIGQMVRILMGQQASQAPAEAPADGGTTAAAAPTAGSGPATGPQAPVDLVPTAASNDTTGAIDLEKLAAALGKPAGSVSGTPATPAPGEQGAAPSGDPAAARPLPAAPALSTAKPAVEPAVEHTVEPTAKPTIEPQSTAGPGTPVAARPLVDPLPQPAAGAAAQGQTPSAPQAANSPAGEGIAAEAETAGTGLGNSEAEIPARATAGQEPLPAANSTSAATESANLPGEGQADSGAEGQQNPASAEVPAAQVSDQTVTEPPVTASPPAATGVSQSGSQNTSGSQAADAAGSAAAGRDAETATLNQHSRTQTLDGFGGVRSGVADQSHQIRSQVVRELAASLDGGVGNEKITLHLNPEKLGQVEIQFIARGNDLNVVITASGREAQQALREGVKELAEGIADRSLRWQQVDIKVEQRGQEQEKNESKQDSRRDQSRREGKQDQGQHHPQRDHTPGRGPDWTSLRGEG